MKKVALTVLFLVSFQLLHAQSWSKLVVGMGEQNMNTMCTDLLGNVFVTNGSYIFKRIGGAWVSCFPAIPYTGYSGGGISTMCTDNLGNYYAIGGFHDDSGKCFVAKWNGSSWSHVGPVTRAMGLDGATLCLDPAGNLYAAGRATGDTVGNVFKFNGTVWAKLGIGTAALNSNRSINSICSDPAGNIYAAGGFGKIIGGTYHEYVAKWNGTVWSELGYADAPYSYLGITCVISDTLGNIYATPILADTIHADSCNWSVCKWNGTAWSILGSGANSLKYNGFIRSLCKDSHGNIYAAGRYVQGFSTSDSYVAKWDGSTWSELGPGVNRLHPHNEIWAIGSDIYDNIYAIGAITDDYGYGFVGRYGIPPTSVTSTNSKTGFSVFPNPAHNTITISGSETLASGETYAIINLAGRTIKTGTIKNGSTIDINGTLSGEYLLQVGQNPENISRIVIR
jgi:hypothetical protein